MRTNFFSLFVCTCSELDSREDDLMLNRTIEMLYVSGYRYNVQYDSKFYKSGPQRYPLKQKFALTKTVPVLCKTPQGVIYFKTTRDIMQPRANCRTGYLVLRERLCNEATLQAVLPLKWFVRLHLKEGAVPTEENNCRIGVGKVRRLTFGVSKNFSLNRCV